MAREPVYQGPENDTSDDGIPGSVNSDGGDPGKDSQDSPADSMGSSPLDEEYDYTLRPQSFKDVVGQKKVMERLSIILQAAQKRKEPLGHILFDGPPGLGKTTLATVLPKEMGTEFQYTSAPSLSAPKDLLPFLTNASYGSVLFIDEIHRLPPIVEEFIYPAMEDYRIDIVLGEGVNARTVNMKLKPFTIIGATTRPGMLTAPLRDRFVNRERLDFYEVDELAEIVRRNAKKLNTVISEEASFELASRSRGTPRKSNNLLLWTRDYAEMRTKDGIIGLEIAQQALRMREVDDMGLENLDRRYLKTLISIFAGGPAGIQAIAHSMNLPPDTLEDEVEPFLLRMGLLQRTPRGRIVTSSALEQLGMSISGDNQPIN